MLIPFYYDNIYFSCIFVRITKFILLFIIGMIIWLIVPVPVAARSKAYVCGRSLAEIVGSNPTGGMDVCLLRMLCVVR